MNDNKGELIPYEHEYNFTDSTYQLMLTKETAEKLKGQPSVISVQKFKSPKNFSTTGSFRSIQQILNGTLILRPVNIPCAGQTVSINLKNIAYTKGK